jgi:hypothetical protein
MLAAALYSRELDAVLDRIVHKPATRLTAVAVVVLIGLPHLSVTVDSSHYVHPYPGISGSRDEVAIAAYFPNAKCPRQPSDPGSSYYLHCLADWTWHRGWAIGDAYEAIDRRDTAVFAVLYAVAVAGLAGLAVRARVPQAV